MANAVIDGTDAVMLSQESAAGKHPDKAVAAMRRVCLGAERQFEPTEDMSPAAHRIDRSDQAIAMSAMFLAARIGVRAIIALTESGSTAQWLSRFRSKVPIYALSRSAAARRRMLLLRDVTPVAFDRTTAIPRTSRAPRCNCCSRRACSREGDLVLLTHGDHTGRGGGTNTLKLLHVGADGIAESLRDL